MVQQVPGLSSDRTARRRSVTLSVTQGIPTLENATIVRRSAWACRSGRSASSLIAPSPVPAVPVMDAAPPCHPGA
ncbi:hypothetical protein CCL16_08090 [Pseudomonas syringae]|nr:hypothetical protein CCL11_19735 [Pseudomonas syringae]PBP67212.1 hypothetical protein CCL21_18285 [Pseudomonas syringae]PBP90950.1 hypothetical protein CCL16_08090 [Pseudomonas syringae]